MQAKLPEGVVGYSEVGQGRPLVFIHGYPLNRKMWEPQLSGLAGAAHLLAPDLWGFGESAPRAQIDMGGYADLVRKLLEARGINEPAVICGFSMGGYVAFEFFRRYRQSVAGMILVDTKPGADSTEAKAGRDKAAALAREQGVAAITAQMLSKLLSPKTYTAKPQLVKEVEQIMNEATVEGIVAALLAMRDRPDSTPTLAEIKQPSIVVGGADDQLFPQTEFQNMAKALPKAKLEIIPDAGHLSNMEQPDLFNRAVKEYLLTL